MTIYFMTKQQPKLHRDQDPGTTQPEGNSIHLNYKFFFFFFFLDTQIFPVLVVNSLCKNIFLIFFNKFPMFSLSGKMDFQIPCFPCAVATLLCSDGNFLSFSDLTFTESMWSCFWRYWERWFGPSSFSLFSSSHLGWHSTSSWQQRWVCIACTIN